MSNGKETTTVPSPWSAVLAIVGGVAGGAAWVSAIGTLVMALRLSDVGAPTTSVVSLVPTEFRFVVGLRFLALPMLLALAVFIALILLRPVDEDNQRRNRRGSLPRYFKTTVYIPLVAAGIFAAVLSESLEPWPRFAIVIVPLVAAGFAHLGVKSADTFLQAGLIIFSAVAVGGGFIALLYEWGRPTKLDLAVAVGKGNLATGGFYVAKTDSESYLLVPRQAKARAGERRQSALPSNAQRCKDVDALRRRKPPDCYFVEVVALPATGQVRLYMGPRAVRVDAGGFNRARQLAALVLRRSEAQGQKRKRAAKTRRQRARRATGQRP